MIFFSFIIMQVFFSTFQTYHSSLFTLHPSLSDLDPLFPHFRHLIKLLPSQSCFCHDWLSLWEAVVWQMYFCESTPVFG